MLLLIVNTSYAQSLTYFVSSSGGNDKNDGLSVSTAWATLTKVNATTFQPGDKILFKSGDSWKGQLIPKGSGTEVSPIIIDMYGGVTKPYIDGNGVIGQGAIYINNLDCLEVNNLEISNDATDQGAERRGVLVEASNYGTMHHIYLKYLYIHNVWGIFSTDDGNLTAKRCAGIGIQTKDDSRTPTRFDNIWIDSCVIDTIQEIGIYTDNVVSRSDYPNSTAWMARRFTNFRITNNTISNLAKNGIILRLLDGGLVEHNVLTKTSILATGNTIFTASCDSTVFQYNEGSYNYAGGTGSRDGCLYDADLRSMNIVFQYSYSHNNRHGLFWNCTVQSDSNIICRYNISQNDQGIIFCLNYPVTSMYVYNNTVYCDTSVSPIIISERNVGSGTRTYYFYNNIIYNMSTSATYDMGASGYTRIFNSNVFYGIHPANEPVDSNAITSDPLFTNPGSGTTGLASLAGYKLQAKSPCINNGARLFNHPEYDFWNNPIPKNSNVDRGASEFMLATGMKNSTSLGEKQSGLVQNYPNPFNPSTMIHYTYNANGYLRLKVYNLQGKCIRTLKEGFENAGQHSILWDGHNDAGQDVSSGVYYTRLESGNENSLIKMVLLR